MRARALALGIRFLRSSRAHAVSARVHRLCVCLRIVPLHPNRTYHMCGLVASVGKSVVVVTGLTWYQFSVVGETIGLTLNLSARDQVVLVNRIKSQQGGDGCNRFADRGGEHQSALPHALRFGCRRFDHQHEPTRVVGDGKGHPNPSPRTDLERRRGHRHRGSGGAGGDDAVRGDGGRVAGAAPAAGCGRRGGWWWWWC